MTKFVKCIDNKNVEEFLTKGKIYEVIEKEKYTTHLQVMTDIYTKSWFTPNRFEEVKQEETKFRFIPKTEITEVIVNGIEGVLIKE